MDERSKKNLATCHPDLVKLFEEVDKIFPCLVLEGQRSREQQEKYFKLGVSKTLHSRHLTSPACAADVTPLPLNWKDLDRFYFFAGHVMAKAKELDLKIRWGGNWDGDYDTADNTFNDLVHYEIPE